MRRPELITHEMLFYRERSDLYPEVDKVFGVQLDDTGHCANDSAASRLSLNDMMRVAIRCGWTRPPYCWPARVECRAFERYGPTPYDVRCKVGPTRCPIAHQYWLMSGLRIWEEKGMFPE